MPVLKKIPEKIQADSASLWENTLTITLARLILGPGPLIGFVINFIGFDNGIMLMTENVLIC